MQTLHLGSADHPPLVPDQDTDALVTPNRDLEPVPRPGSVPPEEGEPGTDDKVAQPQTNADKRRPSELFCVRLAFVCGFISCRAA